MMFGVVCAAGLLSGCHPAAKQWIPLLDWLGANDWDLYSVESIGAVQRQSGILPSGKMPA